MRFESEITIFKLDSVKDALAKDSALATQHLYWSDTNGIIVSKDVVGSISQFVGGNVRIGDTGVGIYIGQRKVAEYGQGAIIGDWKSGEPYVSISNDGFTLYDRKNRAVMQADVSQVISSETSVNYIDYNILETEVNGYTKVAVFSAEYFIEVYDYYVQLIRGGVTTTLTDSQATIDASCADGVATFDFTLANDVISDAQEDTACTIRIATHSKSQVPAYTMGVRSGDSRQGMYSFASGRGCTASGDYSTAMGNNCKATAYASFAVGGRNEADNHYAACIGRNLNSTRASQLVCGMYNDDQTGNSALFVVGNGTGDGARSNAFWVDANGNTHVAGNLIVDGTVTSN